MERIQSWVGKWWTWSSRGGTARKLIGFGLPALLGLIVIVVATQQDAEDSPRVDEPRAVGTAQQAATATQPPPTAEPSPAAEQPTASPANDSRCEEVSQAMLDVIDDGLTASGGGGSLRKGYAVKSDDYENVYMIAADIEGPGLGGDDEIGVWASNSLEPGRGLIIAVDEMAKEFSGWPDGNTTDARLSSADDGVAEARDCAKDS